MVLSYFILLAAIVTLVFGVFVWRAKINDPLNISFMVMSFITSSWIMLNFWLQQSPSELSLRTVLASGPFVVMGMYLLAHFFRYQQFTRRFIYFLSSLGLIALALIVLIFSDHLVIVRVTTATDVITGFWFPVYGLILTTFIIGYIAYLFYILKNSTEERRLQLKYVVIGFFTFLVLVSTFSLILPSLGYTRLAMLGSPSILAFIICSSFAVLEHRLFNIKVVGTAFLIVALWLVLLTKILIGHQSLANVSVDIGVLLLSVGLGILLIRSVLQEVKRREEIAALADQLKVANVHLKELDQMKSEFVSLASHELLTPISAIQGYLSMLLDEKLVTPGSPDAVRYLHHMYDSTKRLAKLVADLLNVSRIEQGRLLVEKTEVDLTQLITTVVADLKFKADEKKLTLIYQPVTLPHVFADHDKLEEVLINLIGNAIKYTTTGTITVNAGLMRTQAISVLDQQRTAALTQAGDQEALADHIEPERRQLVGDQQAVVEVKDSGVGIAKADLNKLFKKFSRAGDGSFIGNGLGLYISKSLIEMMHGRMWANSSGLGKGSSFACSVPLANQAPVIAALEKNLKTPKDAKPLARLSQAPTA